MLTGRAAAMAAVCKAWRPSASSSTAATTPMPSPQTMRKRWGGVGSPHAQQGCYDSVPESEDVMNHVPSRRVARADMAHVSQPMSLNLSMVP